MANRTRNSEPYHRIIVHSIDQIRMVSRANSLRNQTVTTYATIAGSKDYWLKERSLTKRTRSQANLTPSMLNAPWINLTSTK